LNTKTGTISGTPTVASDALTYTVTAVLMLYDMIGVDLRGQDAATVVIAVGIGYLRIYHQCYHRLHSQQQ
jgi:hypothetical protein